MTSIRRALISASDKAGMTDLAAALHELGIEILSTGGTARRLREAAEDRLEDLQEAVESGYERTKASVEAGLQRARHSIDERKTEARDTVQAGKAAVRTAREELERRLDDARAQRRAPADAEADE